MPHVKVLHYHSCAQGVLTTASKNLLEMWCQKCYRDFNFVGAAKPQGEHTHSSIKKGPALYLTKPDIT